jgi:hypothetical protein
VRRLDQPWVLRRTVIKKQQVIHGDAAYSRQVDDKRYQQVTNALAEVAPDWQGRC